ncbi:MAG: peptidylprolyl isomerase [Clostridia bacterium]|nr:peptidylprolyl isomerase [Clostridia bacterium]
MKKSIICLVLTLVMTLALSSCSETEGEYKINDNVKIVLNDESVTEITDTGSDSTSIRKKNVKVKFELEEGGAFVMELYPEYAPDTVKNFLNLVHDEFYSGITFHRVIPGFMAQAGDPEGTGMGGSEEKIKGEFASNGYDKNTLKHERGTVSMARTNDPDSASSQFFICFEEAPHLDGEYAAFGKVVYGMRNVDKIAESAVDENDKPLIDVVIKSAKIISDSEFKKYPKED